jgi:hypothetical protein
MNERYGKNAKIGSTRRSASSAKPKREIGSAPSGKPKPAPAAKKARPSFRDAVPTSPEIKRWRIIWWVLFGIMLANALLTNLVPALRESATAQQVGFAILMASFAGNIYIELVVIRRLRKQLIEQQRSGGKAKHGGKDGS